MKWLEYVKSRIPGRSRGRKTTKKINAETRRELTDMCDRLAEIAGQVSRKDAITILEVAVVKLLDDYDGVTREGIFEAAETVINSKQEGKKRALTTREAVDSYIENEDIISTGIISRTMSDNLMDTLEDRCVPQRDRSFIFKSVILRLAGEMDPDDLKDVLSYQLPDIEQKKTMNRDGHMYG